MHIDSKLADLHTNAYPLGTLLNEGKTKKIQAVKGKPDLVLVISKDDITAGDGAKHDILPSKAVLATNTTCNVFELLRSHGLPIAYIERDNVNSFVAPKCAMLPYEVVVRAEAYGSYLKRNPHLEKGHVLPELVVELFLKTSHRRWMGHKLACDDPLMYYNPRPGVVRLYDPSGPIDLEKPFLQLRESEVFSRKDQPMLFGKMRTIAERAFVILKQAWAREGGNLVDFKVEFGIDMHDELLLADVIDSDSWRVLKNGEHLDKQHYRDGGSPEETRSKYAIASEITDRFLIA